MVFTNHELSVTVYILRPHQAHAGPCTSATELPLRLLLVAWPPGARAIALPNEGTLWSTCVVFPLIILQGLGSSRAFLTLINAQSSFEVIVKALKYFAIDTNQATEAQTQRWKRVATVMKAY